LALVLYIWRMLNMFKKILIGLGIVAAAGLVLVLAPLARHSDEEEDYPEGNYKGRPLTEAELAELEED
jgi:hypothetical protein